MLGRQKKNFIIKLIKKNSLRSYDIVLSRKRSSPVSRLDRIGHVSPHDSFSWMKLDVDKLRKYLLENNVKIAITVVKLLGLDLGHVRKK